MKQPRLEAIRRLQKEYHRNHPWRLSAEGLYIPHDYSSTAPDRLSYWDDVGFILNKRRVLVWWQHPRYVYREAIDERAYQEIGPGPKDNWLTDGWTKNYRKVGRSRKKVVSYTLRESSPEVQAHYENLKHRITQLDHEGIDFSVGPSWTWKRLRWGMGVSLIAPLEVRNEAELSVLAALARNLVLQRTTLTKEFPGYTYGTSEWLGDLRKSSN